MLRFRDIDQSTTLFYRNSCRYRTHNDLVRAVYAGRVSAFVMLYLSAAYDSPGTLIFWRQKSRWNSKGVTPTGGAK